MKDCLFCKFVSGELQTAKVYEDENMIIIRDIEPKAKNHFLMIPKNAVKCATFCVDLLFMIKNNIVVNVYNISLIQCLFFDFAKEEIIKSKSVTGSWNLAQ